MTRLNKYEPQNLISAYAAIVAGRAPYDAAIVAAARTTYEIPGAGQTVTSAATSINRDKLPRVYGYDLPAGASVIDYGCGRYTAHLENNAAGRGLTWYGYDPFNRTIAENNAARELLETGGADYVLCSNVLNVIDSDTALDAVIAAVTGAARVAAVFTVYEGDRGGIGRYTGAGQYQRNARRAWYVERMRARGYNATRRGEYIVVTP